MEYAKKSLNLFYPSTLSDCVSATMLASASMTQKLFPGRRTRPKPLRITNVDHSIKKGLVAHGLRDLLNKVSEAFDMCVSSLVLDEDGTVVETEEFFQTLQENVLLLALGKEQKWTPKQDPDMARLSAKLKPRHDVAKLTFDLYKTNPTDFIGCLNVKATLYGMYSLSYNVHCHRAKGMFKETLRWILFTMETTGHVLSGTSSYMQNLLEEEEDPEGKVSGMGCSSTPLYRILWR